MQRYKTSTKYKLGLRAENKTPDCDPNEIHFDTELRSFKRIVRKSVDLMYNYFENALLFNLEAIKASEREKSKIQAIIEFYLEPSTDNFLNKKQRGNYDLHHFFGVLEKERITDFHVTPVYIYVFNYDVKSLKVDRLLKIEFGKGKYFYLDPENRKCSLFQYAEKFKDNSLVCFPRDGCYKINNEIQKVPLEFISSTSRTSLSNKLSLLPTKPILDLVVNEAGHLLLSIWFGFNSDVKIFRDISHLFFDEIIQLGLNKCSGYLFGVSKVLVRSVRSLGDDVGNVQYFDNIGQYSLIVKCMLDNIERGDKNSYSKIIEQMNSIIHSGNINMEEFILQFNSVAQPTGHDIHKIANFGNVKNGDYSLVSFKKNMEEMQNQSEPSDPHLHISDKPLCNIVQSFKSKYTNLTVRESGDVTELYNGSKKVGVILAVKYREDNCIYVCCWFPIQSDILRSETR